MNTTWKWLLFVLDIISFIGALFITYLLRFYILGSLELGALLKPFLILFLLWIIVFFIFNLYEIESVNPNPRNIGKLLVVMAVNALLGLVFFYIFPYFVISPKLSLLSVSILSAIFLVVTRRLLFIFWKSAFSKSIIFFGDRNEYEKFNFFVWNRSYIKELVNVTGIEDLEKELTRHSSDYGQCLVVIDGHSSFETILKMSQKYNFNITTLRRAYEDLLGKIPCQLVTDDYAAELTTKKYLVGYMVTRYIVDFLLATILLVITSPILILSAIIIKLDSKGPVFIRQKRIGLGEKEFTLYKFRSMIAIAPDGSAEMTGPEWAGKEDKRVTGFGKILRKLHIDEIPQMINILKGDISLIGPRPERTELVEKLKHDIPYYYIRHAIKPGFTGWAQIKFRYARTVDDSREKFEYDLYYLKNRNILLDFGIILKTIQITITH